VRLDSPEGRASAALKMSYYTAPNAIDVLPQRLLLATQRHALSDGELQELVRNDIRLALTYRTKLMPGLVAAYKNAPILGRQFIEKTLGEFDPSALTSMRSGAAQR